MAADISLAELRDDALGRAPDAPTLDSLIEDVGRQRLATYYLYAALIAELVGDDDLRPTAWPSQLTEAMGRLGLNRFAPRTERALDAGLTPAEQSTRRNPGRQLEFAQLVVDDVNRGAFGPLCGDADSVRAVEATDRRGLDLELLVDNKVVGRCKAEDHWELVAQALASAPHGDDLLAHRQEAHPTATAIQKRLKELGISHAVSVTSGLVVGVAPVGTVAGVGTRLIRSRIRTGREQSDALHRLGQALRTLHSEAEGELLRGGADLGL